MRVVFWVALGLLPLCALGQRPPEEGYPAPTARYAMPPPSAQAFKKAGDVWRPGVTSQDLLEIIEANRTGGLPRRSMPAGDLRDRTPGLQELVELAQDSGALFGDKAAPLRPVADAAPARASNRAAVNGYVAKIPAKPTPQFRMVPSPDFSRLAITEPYKADRWYVAVDDRVWEFYEIVDAESLQFSADSKHVVCAGRWEGVWRIVIDGDEELTVLPGRPTELRFWPDNKSVAYIAHGEKADCAVIGGVVEPKYPAVSRLTVSRDGKRFAYAAASEKWSAVVIDGQVHGTGEVVAGPVFTADGKFVRWLTRETVDGHEVVSLIEDETQLKQWKLGGSFRRASLSPDGAHVAIVDTADEGGHFERLTADGEVLPKLYERIERITWSPRGMVAFVGSLRSIIEMQLGTGAVVREAGEPIQVAVIGGQQDGIWFREIIGPLTFENGGKEMSYCGKDAGDKSATLYVWDVDRRASSRFGAVGVPGSGNVPFSGMMLATRPDGTRQRFTLTATPSPVSVNQKEMYDVTVRESP